MEDTLSSKIFKNLSHLEHLSHSRYYSTEEFRIINRFLIVLHKLAMVINGAFVNRGNA